MNERLCIEEVGVDLELCVHAHGHDVDLIIKASLRLNYSFGISSSYIWDLTFLQSWFRPHSPLITISCASLSTCLCRAIPQPNLYFDLSSSITPWYLEDTTGYITSYEFFIN